MRIFLLLLLCSASCVTVAAPLAQYDYARQQVLALPVGQQQDALNTHALLQADSPVARYYRISLSYALQAHPVKAVQRTAPATPPLTTPTALDDLIIDRSLLLALEPFARVHLEARLLQWALADDLSYQTRSEQLKPLLDEATDKQWPRLERWATRLWVQAAIANGDYLTAIMQIQHIAGTASALRTPVDAFDYPLAAAYLDMADAFFYLGNAGMSLQFCQFYNQHLASDPLRVAAGLLCQIRAHTSDGQYKTVWPLLSQLNHLATAHQLTSVRVNSALASARVYLHKGNYRLAEEFAQEARFHARHNELAFAPWHYAYYQIRMQASLGRGQAADARQHWQNMMLGYNSLAQVQAPGFERIKQLVLEATLLGLEQQHQQASQRYQQIHALEHRQKKQFRLLEQLAAFTDEISRQQLAYLQQQARLNESQSRTMTHLAIFTSFFTLILLILLVRVFRQKREIERNVTYDGLTSLDARWFALDKIQRHLNSGDNPGCVVLLDIDHFSEINQHIGPIEADQVLIQLARLFKYQVGNNNIIGRYGGEKFVFTLSGYPLAAAENFVEDLRCAVNRMQAGRDARFSVAKLGPIHFCAAIIEVTARAKVDIIMERCEKQLYQAKSQGSNKTCSYGGDLAGQL
ncbi:GGDEF domain-containing protein [Salinimonas sediminis]|uniref:diguanylate cyclase n=1 Tax=Salinimonas sediminis TaxID=2303538 RepID=A0A346NKB1_9ALTE|nr:GGDEF domain-containing protein [Salinimonas sediminis]AXR05968.1 GGDEF domain-containing protein [Salinimonas sediminis]